MKTWMRDLRRRQPGRALCRIVVWQFMQSACFLPLWMLYRYRSWGVRNIPVAGPVLYVANHQSFYDPMLIGVAGGGRRHNFALGRSTLYGNPFTKLVGILTNSIPVEQGAGDVGAMRSCIDILKQGQSLLIFPEGARTLDGDIKTFEAGAMLIIKRAKPQVVPVAVDGPYLIWPRKQFLPLFHGRMGVMFGEPVSADTLASMKSADAMALLRERVEAMQAEIRTRLKGI